MDPHNPRTLFAGMWQVEMHTWGEYSGGPDSGVYVSHDGGTKWTRIEQHGLPHAPLGKIDVAVAPTNSNRVYALIQTKDQGSVWRSDDAGEHWKAVNYQRALIGRAGYYIRIAVSTGNDNEVLRGEQLVPPVPRRRCRIFTKSAGAEIRTTSGSIPLIPIALSSPMTAA